MQELQKIIRRQRFTADQLYREAECVEEYQEWQSPCLMGYSADKL